MKKIVTFHRLPALLLLLTLIAPLEAKFGKNKIQYEDFAWSYLQTPNFDLYFYEGGEEIARYAAAVAEEAYKQISFQLNWKLTKRVSILIYNSHNDFQQTNVTLGYLEEGIGGFTELFKNRVVLPFEGSYEQFRHVLHHELTHAIVNDLIYGGNVQSIVSGRMRVNIPLWLTEGYAEYSSLDWDSRADMIMRDAAINSQLPPIEYLNYYMAYKGGQSVLRFIGETYGVERIGEIFHEIRRRKDVEQAFKHTLGMDSETLTDKWHMFVRKEFWPDISGRSALDEVGQRLTDHTELENYFNVSPAISPNGGKIAFLSDRSGYADVYVMSAEDGRQLDRIVSGQRNADLEELKWLSPGISWAPDNRHLVFAAKSGNEDGLIIFDTQKKEKKIFKLGLDGIFTAAWSPDGKTIAFSGLQDGRSDLFLYAVKTRQLKRLTNDIFADTRPSWSPDGKRLAFVSDRESDLTTTETELRTGEELTAADLRTTDIYLLTLADGSIERITETPGNEDSPVFSNTRPVLAYTSDRSGIWNIYLKQLPSGEETALTNIMTGIFQLSWSGDDSRLVFSGYEEGGWDIFSLNNPLAEWGHSTQPPLSNYLLREDLQIDLSYQDTLPDREEVKTNPYQDYVFAESEALVQPDNQPMEPLHRTSYADSSGDYRIHDYRTRFTVDLVDAQAGYSNFFGIQGNALMIFSDIMGNHRIQFGFELYKNLDNSDLILGYDYLERRLNFHIAAFNYPDDYAVFGEISPGYYQWQYWHFRQYGAILGMDYPLTKYSRIEGGVTWLNMYERITTFLGNQSVDLRPPRNTAYVLPELTWSYDNVLYGMLYPVDGWRTDVNLRASPNFPLARREFITLRADVRRYFKFFKDYSLALRWSAASSHGPQPEQFMAGGVESWLNYRLNSNYINYLQEYEDLYFSDYVTPVRGAPYFYLVGNHYTALNAEFRFPFIDYLVFRWPISAVLGNVRGNLFADWVRVWDESTLNGRSTSEILFKDMDNSYFGTGLGLRLYLGYFVLRYDLAYDMSKKPRFSDPQHIWSLGLDF